jgi:hypothetical protein
MLARVPTESAVVEVKAGLISNVWNSWLRFLVDAVDRSAQRVGAAVALTVQAASVGPVTATQPLQAGLYRVSVHARVTQAATTSSSLTVAVGYVHGGVACSQAGPALTGNLTTSVQGLVFALKVDQGSTISYTATRASVGATPMQYALDVSIERLST